MTGSLTARMRVRRILLPLVLLTASFTPLTLLAQHSALESALSRFEARIAADVAQDSIASIAAGVVVDGKVVWQRAFGWADVARAVPARSDMLYRTGSISKSFTAMMLVLLAERGVLSLDDPVEKFLPEIRGLDGYPGGAEPITFRQLASHTAGLQREPGLRGAASGPIEGWEEKILASIPTTGFQTTPGSAYGYSNIGFGILGLAISRAAGRPFMNLVTEEIFRPLGMSSSTFVVGEELLPLLTSGYANRRDGTVDAEQPAMEHAGRGYKVPNGGIYSTAADLCRFMAAMCGHPGFPLMSAGARSEILRQQTPPDRSAYGLGFSLQHTEEGVLLAGHGGSVSGYTAHILFAPAEGVGVVLLRNYGSGNTNLGRAARELLIEVLGGLGER